VRPLAPDASRLEFAQVKRRHDEVGFLRDMGAEAANVHLLAHSQAAPLKVLRKDARRRTERWLHGAAVKMADLTNRDHTDWVAWQSKNADKQGA